MKRLITILLWIWLILFSLSDICISNDEIIDNVEEPTDELIEIYVPNNQKIPIDLSDPTPIIIFDPEEFLEQQLQNNN